LAYLEWIRSLPQVKNAQEKMQQCESRSSSCREATNVISGNVSTANSVNAFTNESPSSFFFQPKHSSKGFSATLLTDILHTLSIEKLSHFHLWAFSKSVLIMLTDVKLRQIRPIS
jgi:hypothetical protein